MTPHVRIASAIVPLRRDNIVVGTQIEYRIEDALGRCVARTYSYASAHRIACDVGREMAPTEAEIHIDVQRTDGTWSSTAVPQNGWHRGAK